jgi:lysozyme
MRVLCCIFFVVGFSLTLSDAATEQTNQSKFHQPWKDPTKAIVLDLRGGMKLEWSELAKEPRVAGIIHRASEGLEPHSVYAEMKAMGKKLGYKWGSHHVGRPGDPIKQADFYLATAQPEDDEVIALDLENDTPKEKYMNLVDAQRFIERIKEKTGRYPMLYVTGETQKALFKDYGADSIFSKPRIWYARFCDDINCYFPNKLWDSYTLWQFASEQNCPSKPTSGKKCSPDKCYRNKCPLPSPVPGTDYDMDVNIYYGTVEELRSRWPFTVK